MQGRLTPPKAGKYHASVRRFLHLPYIKQHVKVVLFSLNWTRRTPHSHLGRGSDPQLRLVLDEKVCHSNPIGRPQQRLTFLLRHFVRYPGPSRHNLANSVFNPTSGHIILYMQPDEVFQVLNIPSKRLPFDEENVGKLLERRRSPGLIILLAHVLWAKVLFRRDKPSDCAHDVLVFSVCFLDYC